MLKASSQQNNVGKGSRQLRSVTSGKGLAPRIHDGNGSIFYQDYVSFDCGLALGLICGLGGNVRRRLLCCAINEVLTWNCYEEEESNWLIKP